MFQYENLSSNKKTLHNEQDIIMKSTVDMILNTISETSVHHRNGYLFGKRLNLIVKQQIGENSFSIYCQHNQRTFIS